MSDDRIKFDRDKIRELMQLDSLPNETYFNRPIKMRPTQSDLNRFSKDYPNEALVVGKFRKGYRRIRAKITCHHLKNFSEIEIFMLRDKIDWTYFSKHYPINDELELRFLPYLDWEVISQLKTLIYPTIKKYQELLNFDFIFHPVLTDEIVFNLGHKVNWNHASKISLSNKTLIKHRDKVVWSVYAFNNKLTENQILKYADYIGCKRVCETQNMSVEFILKHQDKVDWEAIYNRSDYATKFSLDIDRKYSEYINWNNYSFKKGLPDDFILEFFSNMLYSTIYNIAKDPNEFLEILMLVDAGLIGARYISGSRLKGSDREKYQRSRTFKNQVIVKFYNFSLQKVSQKQILFTAKRYYHEELSKKSKYFCNRFIFTIQEKLYAVDKHDSVLFQVKPKKLPIPYEELVAILLEDKGSTIEFLPTIIDGIEKHFKLTEYEAFKRFDAELRKYYSWVNDTDYKVMTYSNYGNEII